MKLQKKGRLRNTAKWLCILIALSLGLWICLNNSWLYRQIGGEKNISLSALEEQQKLKTKGSYVTFGHYEQDADETNGKEALEWLVVEYDESTNSSLLLSKYGLDALPFHHEELFPTWAKSDIRAWLNDSFLHNAFTDEEIAAIRVTHLQTPAIYGFDGGEDTDDKIWLFSCDEVEYYLTDEIHRRVAPTAYAMAQGTWQSNGNRWNDIGCTWWWLRSPGVGSRYASSVYTNGKCNGNIVYGTSVAIRPALWLDLGTISEGK